MKNKIIISICIVLLGVGIVYSLQQDRKLGGQETVSSTASSTVFAVTSSASVQLLATSSKRVATEIQPLQCDTDIALYIKEKDVKPTAYTGYAIIASTTQAFGDNAELPTTGYSLRGITAGGNCDKVLVTEWRSNF